MRERVGAWLFAAVVVGSALGLGSLLTWILVIVVVALAAATMLLWWDAEASPVRPAAGILAVTAIGLTVYTALQCAPMPVRWLAALAPETADVWARALRPFHLDGPAWAPLSLDPVATHVQVLRGVAYVLSFVCALRIAKGRDGTGFLQRTLVVSGAALGVAALAHPALGAEKVFWLYEPVNRAGIEARHIAPLLNANHSAGYLNIAICTALAVGISRRPSFPRPIAFAVALVLIGALLWIGSRGAFVGLVFGVIVIGVLSIAMRDAGKAASLGALTLGLTLVTAVTMIVVSTFDAASTELSSTDLSKVALARESMRLTRLFPFFGTGRGAFEAAFPAVRTSVGYVDFTHPENLVVQWVTEWGVPVALVAALAIAWALRPATALARSQPPFGAWAALAALTVHNLVDFSLEVPGVVIALTVCAALVTGGSAASGSSNALTRWSLRPRWVAVGGGVAAAAAIALVLPGMGHELLDERLAVRALANDGAVEPEQFDAALRAAMLRHPAEPYLPFVGALHAFREGQNVVPWVQRTLERSPVFGRAHLVLAQSLTRRSPGQSRLEYRLALEQDSSTHPMFRTEAPRLVRAYGDAMELVPSAGPMRPVALSILGDALRARLPATARRLDDDLVAAEPTNLAPLRRAARDAVSDLSAGNAAPWCMYDREACTRDAVNVTHRVVDADPDGCDGYRAYTTALSLAGEGKKAMDELIAEADRARDWALCLKELATLARSLHEQAQADAALDRLARAGCSTDAECADNLLYVANSERQWGRERLALALYKKAYDLVPNDGVLAEHASLAAKVGLHAEALESYEKLTDRHPGDSRYRAAADAERAAVGQQFVPSASP